MSVLPDAEQIVSTYLRSRSEVTDLVADRVYTEMPRKASDRVFPLVRVVRAGGGPVGSPIFIDRVLVSCDVWGGTKYQAREIAATLALVLDEIAGYSAHGGYSTGSSPGVLRYIPDESFEPPKPRYLLDTVVYFRPSS